MTLSCTHPLFSLLFYVWPDEGFGWVAMQTARDEVGREGKETRLGGSWGNTAVLAEGLKSGYAGRMRRSLCVCGIWINLLVMKTNENWVAYLIFLYHLIPFISFRYFSPMTFINFLKYFFLLTLAASGPPDFSTCLAIPFRSLLGILLSQFFSWASVFHGILSHKNSPFVRSPWHSIPWFSLPAMCWLLPNTLCRPRLFWTRDVSRCSVDISDSLCAQLNSASFSPNTFFLNAPSHEEQHTSSQ